MTTENGGGLFGNCSQFVSFTQPMLMGNSSLRRLIYQEKVINYTAIPGCKRNGKMVLVRLEPWSLFSYPLGYQQRFQAVFEPFRGI